MNGDEGLTVSSDFGKVLRRHRLAAGLSQEALAERARMSSFAISALERGYRRRPQRKTLALLVDALTLDEEQRLELEAAAAGRPVTPRHRPSDFVDEEPSHETITPQPSLAHIEIGPFKASLSRPIRPVAVAIVLALAVIVFGTLVLNRSKSSDEKSLQTVTTLGPFQFDVSPDVKSTAAVTPIGMQPANATFTATKAQTVEVACTEGTRYRAGSIRHPGGMPSTPLPLRYKLIVHGMAGDTYTVGSKFLMDMEQVGAARAFHTFGIEPLDRVPNSTMTFSCVTIVSLPRS